MKGIGTDIVQIERIRQVYAKQQERFVQRLLTPEEQQVFQQRKCSMSYLANRFAAKEAISKALGTGIAKGIRFTDIEILPSDQGAPVVNLYGKAHAHLLALGAVEVMVSLSDEKDYAVAFAVLQ
jgi:holo-[acyl-carrier protein] synthase